MKVYVMLSIKDETALSAFGVYSSEEDAMHDCKLYDIEVTKTIRTDDSVTLYGVGK